MFTHLVFAISLLGCRAASLVPKLKTFGTGRSAFHSAGPEHSIFNYTLSANGQFGACYVTYFKTIRILSGRTHCICNANANSVLNELPREFQLTSDTHTKCVYLAPLTEIAYSSQAPQTRL